MADDALVEPLVEAIVAALIAFEQSTDDQVEISFAVRAMEDMGHALDALDADGVARFKRAIEDIAARQIPGGYQDFIRSVPYMIWGDQA